MKSFKDKFVIEKNLFFYVKTSSVELDILLICDVIAKFYLSFAGAFSVLRY